MFEVYEWYKNKVGLDDELVKEIQKVCMNKRIESVNTITSDELVAMLNKDKRFGASGKLAFAWWWIFDTKYSVISYDVLMKILVNVRGLKNEYTVVAVVQTVTGLNCGFVWRGRKMIGDKVTEEEVMGYGFITEKGLIVFDRNDNIVDDGVVIGFAVFD